MILYNKNLKVGGIKMKKISLIVLVLLMTVILSCSKKENKITLAATTTPYDEILDFF